MTKLAILGDTHFGLRGDSQIFAEYQKQFYDKVFFPELEKRGIKTIIQMGDLLDRRKFINYQTLNFLRNSFIRKLSDYTFYGIVGNHDTANKHDLKINSYDQLFQTHGIKQNWFSKPIEIVVDNLKILFLPWICENNHDLTMRMIEKSSATVVVGHLELSGFEMQQGHIMQDGMDPGIFSKFKLVISGHYHTHSKDKNVFYTGVPYEMTWSDYNDPKGFWILDTETLEMEFVENPITIHMKIFYDDKEPNFNSWIKQSFTEVRGKYIKVVITSREDYKVFDEFISKLEKNEALNIQIIDIPAEINFVTLNPDLEKIELLDLIVDVVKQNKFPMNEELVLDKISNIYHRATAPVEEE